MVKFPTLLRFSGYQYVGAMHRFYCETKRWFPSAMSIPKEMEKNIRVFKDLFDLLFYPPSQLGKCSQKNNKDTKRRISLRAEEKICVSKASFLRSISAFSRVCTWWFPTESCIAFSRVYHVEVAVVFCLRSYFVFVVLVGWFYKKEKWWLYLNLGKHFQTCSHSPISALPMPTKTGFTPFLFWKVHHTVDGRNPAPPGIMG